MPSRACCTKAACVWLACRWTICFSPDQLQRAIRSLGRQPDTSFRNPERPVLDGIGSELVKDESQALGQVGTVAVHPQARGRAGQHRQRSGASSPLGPAREVARLPNRLPSASRAPAPGHAGDPERQPSGRGSFAPGTRSAGRSPRSRDRMFFTRWFSSASSSCWLTLASNFCR